jgi:hypothetical protein
MERKDRSYAWKVAKRKEGGNERKGNIELKRKEGHNERKEQIESGNS